VKIKLGPLLSTATAISLGLIVLLGYFVPAFSTLRFFVLQGAVILTAVGIYVGLANLISVHLHKIQNGPKRFFSGVLLLSLFGTLVVGLYDLTAFFFLDGESKRILPWVFENIQLPFEKSLMAVMAIGLTYALFRLSNQKLNLLTGAFVFTVLLTLLGSIPFVGENLPLVERFNSWIINIPAVGGVRGILLGIALGTMATGIRILLGSDRPYSG
jgi:hypothetical protein